MAVTGRFEGDFSDFNRAVQDTLVKFRGFEVGVASVEGKLNRMVDSFSGRKVISEATLMAAAVERIGGTSKLTESELQRMGSVAAEAAAKMRAFGQEVPQNIQALATHAKGATAEFSGMRGVLNSLSSQLVAMFSVGAVLAFGRSVLAAGDTIQKMADQTSLGTAEVQRLEYIAGQSGTTVTALVGAVQNLQQRLGDGDAGATGALKRLNINLEEFGRLDAYQQMLTLSSAIRDVKSPTDQASIAADLFGKSWKEILPAIKSGMREVGEQAPIMADETVKSLDRIGDALTRAKQQITSWGGLFVVAIEEAGFSIGNFLSMFNPAHFGRANAYLLQMEVALNDKTGLAGAMSKLKPPTLAVAAAIQTLGVTAGQAKLAEMALTDSAEKSIAVHTKQVAAMKTSGDARKKFAEELLRSTDAAHKLESGFYGLSTAVATFDTKEIDALKHMIEIRLKINDVEEATHIAVFGFKGMADGLQNLGTKFPIDDALRFEQAMEFVGPQLEDLKQTDTALHDLAQSFVQLAQISGDSFGGIVKDIAQIAAAMDLAAQAGAQLAAGMKGGGFSQMAVGIVGMVGAMDQATKSTSRWSATFGGASAGAAMGGKVFPIVGTWIGAAAGALVGFFRSAGAAERAINPVREQFVQLSGGLHELNVKAQAAGVSLTAMLNAKNPEAYKKAIDELNAALDAQAKDVADLEAAITEYGFSMEQLGPTLQRQKLDEQAKKLLNDWRLLVGAGIDLTAVNEQMAAKMNEYLAIAARTGTEVPAAMKPILQTMIDQGMLTDEAGVKVESLEAIGVTFSETMTQGFDRIVKKLSELLEKIGLVPAAVNSIPTQHTIRIGYEYEPFNPPSQESHYAAMGGLVTATGMQHFAAGGNVLPFRPRGSDTVPAMLTPGEMVLTKGQQANLLLGQQGNNEGVERRLDQLMARQAERDRLLPKLVRDAVLLAR